LFASGTRAPVLGYVHMINLTRRESAIIARHLGRMLRTQSSGIVAEPLPSRIALNLLHLQRAEDERQLGRDG